MLTLHAQIRIITTTRSAFALPRLADYRMIGGRLHIEVRLGGVTVQRLVPEAATREAIITLMDDARAEVARRMVMPAVTR